jgi:8-oxo-dGTP pyrophosphatase MutT (NUDIX family)
VKCVDLGSEGGANARDAAKVSVTIDTFLARHELLATGEEMWSVPLRLDWYRGDELPPVALITSVRALVFRDDTVLVVREPSGQPRIIPGGRCEAGETIEETVRREVLEEVGWALGPLLPLGFLHLFNLGPKPPGSPYPYPDAFQVIYQAEALTYCPEAMVFDEWVASSSFVPIAEARRLPIRAGELALLDVAARLRDVSP